MIISFFLLQYIQNPNNYTVILKGHLSLSSEISDALDSKIQLNCSLHKTTFSLQKGWSYNRAATAMLLFNNELSYI
jgi:hypothetical protein